MTDNSLINNSADNMKSWFPITNDVIFKKFFTDSSNQENLKSFLCTFLNIDINNVTDIEITNSEITPKYADGKVNRLDILLKLKDQNINIEMQNCSHKYFIKRVLFYWSKMYTNNLKEGQDYSDLKSSVSINILNYIMFKETEDYMSSFSLYEDQRKELLTDVMRLYFLELPKVDNNLDVSNKRKLWLQLIKAKSKDELEMLKNTDIHEIQKAVETLNTINEDQHLRALAWEREKAELDYISEMNEAEARGKEEGLAEGIEIGKKESEIKTKQKMAINLYQQNHMTVEQIAKIAEENIETIKQWLNLGSLKA